MANGENNNYWVRWLVATLFTIVFGAVTTLASNVMSNDKAARDRDTSQIEDLNGVKQDVIALKTDIGYIKEASKEQKENMRELLRTVQDIKRNTT